MTRQHRASVHVRNARTLMHEALRLARWGARQYADELKRQARLEMRAAHKAMELMA